MAMNTELFTDQAPNNVARGILTTFDDDLHAAWENVDDDSIADNKWAWIVDALPQKRPFRFVDRILDIDEKGANGAYTFRPTEWFYAGHFPGNPVTPGVILTECMAQIGLVSLGIYLSRKEQADPAKAPLFLFSDCQVEFLRPVRPGETLMVRSELVLWRMGKLRANVWGEVNGELAAMGKMSGMRIPS